MTPVTLKAERVLGFLDQVRLLPRRLVLETPGVEATAGMLRGVWGEAFLGELHVLRLNAPAARALTPVRKQVTSEPQRQHGALAGAGVRT